MIDLSGGILAVVALTETGILLYLKKSRNQALTIIGIATVIVGGLAWHAIA